MTTVAALALVLAAVCVTSLAKVLVAPYVRPRCPGCLERRLEHSPTRDSLYVLYRCARCAERWVACGSGLVAHEAFTAGAREPIPVARIVSANAFGPAAVGSPSHGGSRRCSSRVA